MIWICPAGLLPRAFAGITKETSLLSQKSKCKDEMSQICHHVWRIYSRMRPTQSESKLRNTAGDQTVFEPLDIVEFKTITPQHFSLSDPVNLFIFFFQLKEVRFWFLSVAVKESFIFLQGFFWDMGKFPLWLGRGLIHWFGQASLQISWASYLPVCSTNNKQVLWMHTGFSLNFSALTQETLGWQVTELLCRTVVVYQLGW